MADQQDTSDRTHEATPRRLRDARNRGEVSRSRDVAPTAVLLVTTALVALYAGDAGAQFAALLQLGIDSIGRPFDRALAAMAQAAAWTLVSVTLTVALPVAVVAIVAEFLHVGPVFSSHPMTPDLSRLDPIAGLKRMVKADSWIELIKSVAKTATLLLIAVLVSTELMPRLGALHRGNPSAFGEAMRVGTLQLFGWTVAVFSVVTVLDALYQRHSFLKRMRMTHDEVRRENREDTGDPLIRQQRRALQREWAQRSELAAAETAHMLVVNPTHVAIALDWHPEREPVPVVSAKGEDRLALRMRAAAEAAEVPVLRDVTLARALLQRGETGEVVPEDLFDAVAQAIVWAQALREPEEDGDGDTDGTADGDAKGAGIADRAASPEALGPSAAQPTHSPQVDAPPARPQRPRRPPMPPEGPR